MVFNETSSAEEFRLQTLTSKLDHRVNTHSFVKANIVPEGR